MEQHFSRLYNEAVGNVQKEFENRTSGLLRERELEMTSLRSQLEVSNR